MDEMQKPESLRMRKLKELIEELSMMVNEPAAEMPEEAPALEQLPKEEPQV